MGQPVNQRLAGSDIIILRQSTSRELELPVNQRLAGTEPVNQRLAGTGNLAPDNQRLAGTGRQWQSRSGLSAASRYQTYEAISLVVAGTGSHTRKIHHRKNSESKHTNLQNVSFVSDL